MLKEAGIEASICDDLAALERVLEDDLCFVIVTEEAMVRGDLSGIATYLATQAPWSDLPFIVLTRRGGGVERNPAAARLSQVLGNVTFLERPFHPTSLISLARAAGRGRQRQFDARTRMEELAEGERRLQTALLAGRFGSWELDVARGELTTTAACKALFGRGSQDSLTYEELLAAIHPEDRPAMQETLRRAMESGADYAAEYRVIWPDGSIHWAEIRARVVKGARGVERLNGVSSDITERRRAEETLRLLNQTLEDRVRERTTALEDAHRTVLAEIAQREHTEHLLRQAQKMEMLGQLTGGIAHDFNNLLTAVIGNLELLRRRIPGDARTNRLLDGASQGAQRGAQLTQRLLAFARRQELKAEPTDVVALIGGMNDLIEGSIGSRIELALDVPDTLPFALIDANQVELALLNLVVNARDAMPQGGALSVRAEAIDTTGDGDLRPGRYVRISVRDTGQGMDSETLAKATEPFFSTKELGKGTGLGLSMVHGLAVQLGGALRLSSEKGEGTVAELWLPVTDRDVATSAEPESSPARATTARKLKVLVVDDDKLISMSTVAMLEDLGHDAVEVNSPQRALEVLGGNQPFDLMITDYSMPRMTGTQLAEKVRETRPGLPILLATGYAEDSTGPGLPRLAKPFYQAQLRDEIAKLGIAPGAEG